MNKIIAFAGSNSSKSINQQLIQYIATHNNNIEVIKLTDYNIPMYSEDLEEKNGIDNEVIRLNEKLSETNKLIISVAEHNGNLSAFFKNILDWLSRNNRNFLQNKEIILFSTSPGGQGAVSALNITKKMLPFFGATITSVTSIGNFYEVFKNREIIDPTIKTKIKNAL